MSEDEAGEEVVEAAEEADDSPFSEHVHIQFWKKLDMASDHEPCAECLAKPVCKLQDVIHKIKVGGKEKTIIESCSLMVQ